jgi:hypothetical protein
MHVALLRGTDGIAQSDCAASQDARWPVYQSVCHDSPSLRFTDKIWAPKMVS